MHEGDSGALRHGERQLHEAATRALRQPAGKLALVLHLSRLAAPREHHVRVAHVLLHDTAQRHAGHVFAMANHDLVLLCAGEAADGQHAPSTLPATLSILFAADVPDAARLTSLWKLDTAAEQLLAYVAGRSQALPVASAASRADQPIGLVALEEIILNVPLHGLLTQRTGMRLLADRTRPLAARLTPAYQQISVELGRLGLDGIVARALGDPFLHRHFAATLDGRLIGLLHDDLRLRGRLLRHASAQRLPVLIELGLRGIVSPAFAMFARLAATNGIGLLIGVSLLQAGAELDLLEHARGVLALTGAQLALTRIDPACLTLVDPLALRPDIMLLGWSAALRPAMRDFSQRPRAPGVLPPRIVLDEADGEQAIAWGQGRGIELFGGAFLDQVQAATRMQRCHSAAECTLGQCRGRARALALPGRAGCANPALLEAGFVPSAAPLAPVRMSPTRDLHGQAA